MAGDRIASTLGEDARWHARLATLLAASGKFERAASHYRRALQGLDERADSAPEDEAQTRRQRLQWQFELAATETKRGHHSDAIKLYEEILQTDPECVEAQVNMAAQLAIADAGRLEEALELCIRVLALRPDLVEAHYNRNMLLRRLGRQQEAVSIYWESLSCELGANVVRQSIPDELAPLLGVLDGVCIAKKNCCELSDNVASNQERDEGGFTVICVKWGTKYKAEYVNRLYNSVMRHSEDSTPPKLTFVCLTDNSEGINPHSNLHIIPLDAGWKGWWNKCQLFSSSVSSKLRALGNSRCFYIDLDTVIVGSLGELLAWSPPVGVLGLLKTDLMENEQRVGGYNSSIVMWRIDNGDGPNSLQFLYNFLRDHFAAVNKFIYKFDHWLEMAHPGACFIDSIFPDQIVEYRRINCLGEAASPPPNASIVCFPLLPKPHKATAPWIAHHWV